MLAESDINEKYVHALEPDIISSDAFERGL
jgi:hypothetical protein